MENSGFSHLGFFSLSILYFMLGAGSLISTTVMNKVGVKQSMAIGAVFDALWILCQIIPALKSEDESTNSVFLSDGFIYFSAMLSATLDGLGNAI